MYLWLFVDNYMSNLMQKGLPVVWPPQAPWNKSRVLDYPSWEKSNVLWVWTCAHSEVRLWDQGRRSGTQSMSDRVNS